MLPARYAHVLAQTHIRGDSGERSRDSPWRQRLYLSRIAGLRPTRAREQCGERRSPRRAFPQAFKILLPRFHSPLVARTAARQFARRAGRLLQEQVQLELGGVRRGDFLLNRLFESV